MISPTSATLNNHTFYGQLKLIRLFAKQRMGIKEGKFSFHHASSFFHHFGNRRYPNLHQQIGLKELRVSDRINEYILFVNNMPRSIKNIWLRQIFKYPRVVCDVFTSSKTIRNREERSCFVRFTKEKDAQNAIKNNDLIVKGLK